MTVNTREGGNKEAAGDSRIALYLTDANTVIAHVAIDPPDNWLVGPVHRARQVQDAEDFARFLRSSAPEETLGGLVVNGSALRDEHHAAVADLEGGFRTLAASIARKNLNIAGMSNGTDG